jgi:putative endonuclease
MEKTYFVYIVTNRKNGVLYIGSTSNLVQRMAQHRSGLFKGFTEKYQLYRLVYFEETRDAYAAVSRERLLKKWNREWKLALIRKQNPEWQDLSE